MYSMLVDGDMSTENKKSASTRGGSKKQSSKPGVFDVAHPGKGAAASATARPVISGKGPMVQDPTVVNESDAQRETAPLVEGAQRVRKTVIQPLHSASEKNDDKPADEAVAEQIENTASSDATTNEKETPAATESPATQQEAPATPTNDIQPALDNAPPTTAPGDEDATAKIIKEHMLRIEKLVDSEQYFLPINAVQNRKNRRFVAGGVLLIIILAVAWYNIALDAGLLPNLYNVPHTEFFTVK